MNTVYAEVYKGLMGKYRWRAKNIKNSQNMANGSQGYVHKVDALWGMRQVLGLEYDTETGKYTRSGYDFIVADLTHEPRHKQVL